MLRRGATWIALLLLAAATSYAQNTEGPKFSVLESQAAQGDPKTYTLDETSVRIQNLGPVLQAPQIGGVPAPAPMPIVGVDPLVVIDQIINLGQTIWDIIKANAPVVNIQTQYATALPKGITSWGQLAGWKPPEGTVYGFSANNLFGMKVVNVRYQVLRTCGGNYNGKGKYLTAVTIQPVTVDVLWGYHCDLSVEIPASSVVNVGTAKDPVAAMQPLLKWTISTVLKSSSGQSTYYVQGDGLFKELSGPFMQNYQGGVAKALDNAVKYRFQ
jgi:hypothetical protein